jgi:hypothetical protein
MTLTLKDAVGQYRFEAAAIVDAQPPTTEAKRALALSALDAAVKDAMLAAGELGQRFRFYTRVGGHQWDRAGYEAEVERLFEGGKK